MPRDGRKYFRCVKRRQLRRYTQELNALAHGMKMTAEQKGDMHLDRLITILNGYKIAQLPNGDRLAPSIQQKQFDWKFVVAVLPILYGSAFKVRIIRERIMRKLGVGPSFKILFIQMNRQCGKTTEMMKIIAAMGLTTPIFQIVTGHTVGVGQKLILGVAKMVRALQAVVTDIELPTIDTRREGMNNLFLLWNDGSESHFQRMTASPKRYVFHTLSHARRLDPSRRNTSLCQTIHERIL